MSLVFSVFGRIEPPIGGKVGGYSPSLAGGFDAFVRNLVILIFIVAGLWSLVNFIIAGLDFLAAAGSSDKLAQAWARIWQSLLGLVIMITAFALAAVFGQILFGRWDFILSPEIPGPVGRTIPPSSIP